MGIACGSVHPTRRTRGAVARKALPSGVYLYWQFRDVQGLVRQVYLGLDNEATQSLVQRLQDEVRTNQAITAELERAAAAFLSAGGRVAIAGAVARELREILSVAVGRG